MNPEQLFKTVLMPSPIHGKGLFASQSVGTGPVFRKGDLVAIYEGQELTRAQALDGRDRTYIFKVFNDLYIDGSVAKDKPWGHAAYINHAPGKPNCKITIYRKIRRPIVRALRDIYHCEELLFKYGYDPAKQPFRPCDPCALLGPPLCFNCELHLRAKLL